MLAPAGVALLAGPAMPPARSAGLWASLGAFPHISLIRAIGELSDGEWIQPVWHSRASVAGWSGVEAALDAGVGPAGGAISAELTWAARQPGLRWRFRLGAAGSRPAQFSQSLPAALCGRFGGCM